MKNILLYLLIVILFISCRHNEIDIKGNWSVYNEEEGYSELYFDDTTVQIFWEIAGNIGFKDYSINNDSLFYYEYFVALIKTIDSETIEFVGEEETSIAKRIYGEIVKYDSTTMSSRIENNEEAFGILLDGFYRRKCEFIKNNEIPYEYYDQKCSKYEEDSIIQKEN